MKFTLHPQRTAALFLFVVILGCSQEPAATVDPELERLQARAERVTIFRDDFGVPHIYAETDADAVFGLLYAQAEDDFPRVERNYYWAIGRLAEAEGIDAIYSDLRARPGATDNLQPITAEMVRTIPQPPPLPPPFTVEGAIEGEKLEVADASEGVAIAPQALWKKNTYSNDQHAWVRATQAGQFVEWRIPVENPGKRNVIVYLTKSWDYGVVQCFVNGEKAGKPIDTFNDSGRGRELGATGGVNLGEFDLGESFTLRIETAGTNENSEPPHYYFGLDCVVVE